MPYWQGEQGTRNSEDSDGMMVMSMILPEGIILPATGSGAHAQEGEGSSAVMSKARMPVHLAWMFVTVAAVV